MREEGQANLVGCGESDDFRREVSSLREMLYAE